jgi:hypothetical protein
VRRTLFFWCAGSVSLRSAQVYSSSLYQDKEEARKFKAWLFGDPLAIGRLKSGNSLRSDEGTEKVPSASQP